MLLFPAAAAQTLLLLLAALVLDAVGGGLPWLFARIPHPVVLIGRAIDWFDRRLNRQHRSDAARRIRGIVTVGALVAGMAALGLVLETVFRAMRYGWVIEVAVVTILLAQQSLYRHVAEVGDALERRGLGAGREAVRHIVGRDPQSLDEYAVARAAIESLAENFSDGVVAPALWYALLGLPGLFAYKTASTLDSMIGHKSPRYLQFGWAAARLDDLLNLVPARLSGVLLAAAALLTPQTRARPAFHTMLRDAGKHRSPNAGWPEAAAAGALDLALAGPRRYHGTLVEEAWLGDGRARATTADIGRALRLYIAACALHAALVLAVALAV